MAYTTINKSGDYFNSTLYTGNGSNGHAITGVGFQPDVVWLKNRSSGTAHVVVDAIRGQNKVLSSNNTEPEATTLANKDFKSFDSDGFTVDQNNSYGSTNTNGANIVSWNWKANGTGSANTDGDINSTVSVNQTAGFSIVKYTGTDVAGATVGHGLNAVPKMIILKRLVGSGYDWVVYHKDKTAGLYLNSAGYNNDSSSNNIWFNGAAPTSSVFSIGTDGRIGDATDFIAYCFAEKTGYSKFGKYTATGSTSVTPFIYTGFKPQFVMTKNITGSDAWTMSDIPRDNAVGGGNGTGSRLRADNAAGEDTNTSWASIQKYSNGFSPQGNDHVTNGSGQSYIYMAFGQSIVGSNNIPATAR
jgi:hypothetical protein